MALVTCACKLRPYFQAHPITVLTSQPLKNILHKPEASGRLTKWAIELGEHDISYKPRTAIKSQVPADFIADFNPFNEEVGKPSETMQVEQGNLWTLHVDGASSKLGVGLGIYLVSPEGECMARAIRCEFETTNNEAEYEALIAGLQIASSIGIRKITVRLDSQLIVNQVKGSFQVKGEEMAAYQRLVSGTSSTFELFEIEHVPRT